MDDLSEESEKPAKGNKKNGTNPNLYWQKMTSGVGFLIRTHFDVGSRVRLYY